MELHGCIKQFFGIGDATCLTVACLDVRSLGRLAAAAVQCKQLCIAEFNKIDWWIYVIGGARAGPTGAPILECQADEGRLVERYSVAENAWQTLPALPHACVSETVSALVAESVLHVLGKMKEPPGDWIFVRFNPHVPTWEELVLPPYFDGNMHAVVLDGRIYVAGYDCVMRYGQGGPWEVLPALPFAGCDGISKLLVVHGTLYVFSAFFKLCRYKPAMEEWEMLKVRDDLFEFCSNIDEPSVVSLGKHIFVAHVGEDRADDLDGSDYWLYSAFCWVYDCLADQWKTVRAMPTIRRCGDLVPFEGHAFFIGGMTRAPGEGEEFDSNCVEAWGPPPKALHNSMLRFSLPGRPCWKILQKTVAEAHQVYVTIGRTKQLYAIGGSGGVHGSRDESIVERFMFTDSGSEWVTCAPVPTISIYCENGAAVAPAAKIPS